MIAYTRLEYSNKGILYAKIPNEFNPMIITHFSSKFPLFYIMLEHKGKTYVLKHDKQLKVHNEKLGIVLKNYEFNLPDSFDFSLDSKTAWSIFYDSQYIKQRRNVKLFHHFIPKKLKQLGVLSKEFESINNNKKLNELI
ncbi:MAG: DUF4130 domain-containing protein [Candidatus Nanoarchaeia archaeon]|jgi:hypothetical protein